MNNLEKLLENGEYPTQRLQSLSELKKAITYTTKYMLKINEQDKLYVPKIMCSAGIGKKWTEGIGAERAKYVPRETLEEYRGVDGIKRGLPIYYRNLIYTEEEREKLWIEKLNKGFVYSGNSTFNENTLDIKNNDYVSLLNVLLCHYTENK